MCVCVCVCVRACVRVCVHVSVCVCVWLIPCNSILKFHLLPLMVCIVDVLYGTTLRLVVAQVKT